MTDSIYIWCYKNPECKMQNLVDQSQIDVALEESLKSLLICANCGLGNSGIKRRTSKGGDFLECIPFEGWEQRLPTGRYPNGKFVDFQGRKLDKNDFIETYGIDPDQYLNWRDARKPRPSHKY